MTDVDRLVDDLDVRSGASSKFLYQLLEFVLFRNVSESAKVLAMREKLTSERDRRQIFAPASTIEVAMASPIPMEAPVYLSVTAMIYYAKCGVRLTY